jgi:hypothetical protein
MLALFVGRNDLAMTNVLAMKRAVAFWSQQ